MISQREMRSSSGEVLRRVVAGEALVVSNRGRPAAVLVPVLPSSRDLLIADGPDPARTTTPDGPAGDGVADNVSADVLATHGGSPAGWFS